VSESVDVEGLERKALSEVEGAVGRLLEEMKRLEARTQRAETRVRDVEALLRRFTRGDEDPAQLQRTVSGLQEENEELRSRIEEGREAVERLLARIRFLEEQP
jgi:predicted RNase H-like nuclease (RuvC/YqgF family)